MFEIRGEGGGGDGGKWANMFTCRYSRGLREGGRSGGGGDGRIGLRVGILGG